jgi:hypothetical protein
MSFRTGFEIADRFPDRSDRTPRKLTELGHLSQQMLERRPYLIFRLPFSGRVAQFVSYCGSKGRKEAQATLARTEEATSTFWRRGSSR